ncbi:HNH endonuclease family protein [Streptomyces sp. NPDC102467]|uniref:HNH endonuclease family protein n=1 Tax=Streptomyces sp. NPDC102467 TaxID=3366179 RepID=UPI00381C0423
MKTPTMRGLAAVALLVLPLLSASQTQSQAQGRTEAKVVQIRLQDGIASLPLATEHRAGYERTRFRHWVDEDHDHCNTRAEVLIAESRTEPVLEGACTVTAGTRFSYYDGTTVTDPAKLDIDHLVPLAEAWASGASQWTPARREAYANDLGAERSLVAVTARTNRSKSDQDPAEWLPPAAEAYCQYVTDWVSTKLRWKLTADPAEIAALNKVADGCGYAAVAYEPAAEDH